MLGRKPSNSRPSSGSKRGSMVNKPRSYSSDSKSDSFDSFHSDSGSSSSLSTSEFSGLENEYSSSRRSLKKRNSVSKSPRDKRSLSRSSSVHSSDSSLESVQNLSRANSLKNLEAEYEPIASNLPFNVYQTLFSIKSSNLKIYTLIKEFQVEWMLTKKYMRIFKLN